MRLLLVATALFTAACAARRQTAVVPSAQQYAQDRQAINAVDSGDGDYQVKQLRAKLDADPRDLATRLELARRYQSLGFSEVAIEHCRLACERAPESDDAHIALAKMLRESHRTEEGVKALADYTAGRPSAGVSAWAWLGLLSDEIGDTKSGEAAHRKALALAPGRDDLHNNLGYCLLLQKKNKEAAEEFRAALQLNPRSVVATNNLAAALGEGAPKEALERLQSVSDPATAHSNLAAVLIEAGRYDDARREIEIALSYNRQHPAALSNLALVSQKDGKLAEVKALARPEKKWARVTHAWHRFIGDGEPLNHKVNDTGTLSASRQPGEK